MAVGISRCLKAATPDSARYSESPLFRTGALGAGVHKLKLCPVLGAGGSLGYIYKLQMRVSREKSGRIGKQSIELHLDYSLKSAKRIIITEELSILFNIRF